MSGGGQEAGAFIRWERASAAWRLLCVGTGGAEEAWDEASDCHVRKESFTHCSKGTPYIQERNHLISRSEITTVPDGAGEGRHGDQRLKKSFPLFHTAPLSPAPPPAGPLCSRRWPLLHSHLLTPCSAPCASPAGPSSIPPLLTPCNTSLLAPSVLPLLALPPFPLLAPCRTPCRPPVLPLLATPAPPCRPLPKNLLAAPSASPAPLLATPPVLPPPLRPCLLHPPPFAPAGPLLHPHLLDEKAAQLANLHVVREAQVHPRDAAVRFLQEADHSSTTGHSSNPVPLSLTPSCDHTTPPAACASDSLRALPARSCPQPSPAVPLRTDTWPSTPTPAPSP